MSDLELDIGAFHVYDVLEKLDTQLKTGNPDLARYRQQLSFSVAGNDVKKARAQNIEEEKTIRDKLEKYKVLRILERTWELRPDRDWYVFVDTDTYIVRSNLMQWLGQFDPYEPAFFANPPDPDATNPYAVGGSTFILSRQAMHDLFSKLRENEMADWDTRVTNYRSSFDVLYSALHTHLKLGINNTWPSINGFQPRTLSYGPDLWCEPVIAMHSVPIEIASEIWRLERDREGHNNDPLLFADLWIHFVQSKNLTTARDDWDNLSSDVENARWNILFEGVELDARRGHRGDEEGRAANGEASWEACQASCNNHEHCVQWSYSSIATPNYNENGATRCHVSRGMRFGGHVEPKETTVDGKKQKLTWKSGWRKDNFEKWARQQRCKGQQS